MLKTASPGKDDPRRGLCVITVLLGLEPHYVGNLRAFGAALDVELHSVGFVQVAKTFAPDGREVGDFFACVRSGKSAVLQEWIRCGKIMTSKLEEVNLAGF